ncbi:DUF6531 domain-containing protein [Burkholderia sp. BKH01]|uniref:RHS repeat-associated core domain-containing protein n=1 Tax=Burkholderia sp. BKH01 TaxID=2769262 RepID=UPI0021E063A2|nr:RHS repeat-associated core domain-containing protein [Burkholderia sp. BKH01]MCU9955709.1 DUF6531 domain-containing protein [Burkholderia sp. BKH01]
MALPAVKHLDPVVGVDVHSVLVTPGTPPVFLPHPHVGFMLDKREYIQAAKAVVGCIAMMIAQEKVTEYIEDHPEDVKKLEHLADEANQQVNEQLDGLMGGGKLPDFKDDPNVAEGMRLAKEANKIKNRISDDLGSNVGSGGSSGRPIFVNGMMRATAGTHAYHVPGLHFPLGESFAPPPEKVEPSNDGESFMGSKTVLANNDPMSYMALEALSCWSVGMEPPPHNSAHTDRTYPSMPSSVMLPIPAGRPVLVGGPPIMNMAAAAKGLFKAFQGSKWAKALADKLNLKSGFLKCKVLDAEPVNSTTGGVVMQQHDFQIAGRLPFVWTRYYATHDIQCGAVGAGWQTPADIRLDLIPHESVVGVVAHTPDCVTAFDALPDDTGWPARVYDWQHGHALYRLNNYLVLRMAIGIEYAFALPKNWQRTIHMPTGGATLTLSIEQMADLNGNAWTFERGRDQDLVRVIERNNRESTGRVIECRSGTIGQNTGRTTLLTSLTLVDANDQAYPLVHYEHDRQGNLIAARDAMGQPHCYAYDDDHRMVRHTSAGGVSFCYSHRQHDDGVWRVDRAWGDRGIADYRFAYDLEHRETRITDSLQHTTILQTNDRSMPVARIDPLGGVRSYKYDGQGRTSAEIDPAGRITTWKYDEYGNLLALTLPDGSIVAAEYNTAHQLVCVTAPGEKRWRYEWDECGNLLARTTPGLGCMRYEYDRNGRIVATTGPRGAVTRFTYDHHGNLAQVVDALGNRTRYTYDARANLIQTVNALGQATCYEYDRNGNLTRVAETGDQQTFYSYDADGNLTRYRDPNGHVLQLEYSALGQITKRVAPNGSVIEYRYDTEEQLIGLVNELGESYQLIRDPLGRIVEEIDFYGQHYRYEYNSTDYLLSTTDPLGRSTKYETDSLGRILKKHVQDPRQPGAICSETFSYDSSGNLVSARTPNNLVELKYNTDGQVIEENQGNKLFISSTYDTNGNRVERLSKINVASETITHSVKYEYDALNEISLIQIDESTPITFERDALGQIITEHLCDETRRELSYTPTGFLTKQSISSNTGPLFSCEYSYDKNGEIIEKYDSRLGIDRYEYDSVGNLIRHLDPAGKLSQYLHDSTGDLMHMRSPWRNHTDFFGQEQLVTSWIRENEHDGCYYGFDRSGNLVRKRDQHQDLMLSWDGDGLLIETLTIRNSTEVEANPYGMERIYTRYEYDAFHRRTAKHTQISNDNDSSGQRESASMHRCRSSWFFWEGDALVGEITYDDPAVDRRLFREAQGISEERSRTCTYLGNPGDDTERTTTERPFVAREWLYYPGTLRPLAGIHREYTTEPSLFLEDDVSHGTRNIHSDAMPQQRVPQPSPRSVDPIAIGEMAHLTLKSLRNYLFYSDPNGAIIRVIGNQKNIIWECNYDALGGINHLMSEIEFKQPLQMLGQYFDSETGLCYMRHRYYDARSGQFISADPIRLAGGINLYRYAPNTVTWADPLGLAANPYPIPVFDPDNPISFHAIWGYVRSVPGYEKPENVSVIRSAYADIAARRGANVAVLRIGKGDNEHYYVFGSGKDENGNSKHAEEFMFAFMRKNKIKPSDVTGAYSVLSPCAEKCLKKTNSRKMNFDWSFIHVGGSEARTYSKIRAGLAARGIG